MKEIKQMKEEKYKECWLFRVGFGFDFKFSGYVKLVKVLCFNI